MYNNFLQFYFVFSKLNMITNVSFKDILQICIYILSLLCSVIHSQLGAKQSFSSSQLEERRVLGQSGEGEGGTVAAGL